MDSRISGPLRRKFSNGFSGKPIVGAQKLLSPVEDYTEIFGGVGSSSIPVLDLSADNDTCEAVNFRSSDLDYSNIFGGFRDEGIGVSYEELVCNAELRGERNLSGNIRTGSATGSPSKSSDHSSLSKENQVFSSEAPYLSFNDKKHFNMSYHKTSVGSKDESNEKIHVAQFHPEPGFTFFVDDSTPQKSKADQPDSSITSDIRRKLDFSDGLLESHHNKKAMPHPDTKKPNRRQVDPATGFNQDGSYSNVKLNAHVINLKPIPSNERLSPNGAAHKENSNGITKRSTASNSEAPKGIASEQATGDGSLPLFDQELDVNSAAAVSAAALKDAIQKAQKSIRMAKELMERKKAGLRNHPNQGIKPSSFPYLDKETLMKQVIVEKEEEDEKAHDMGFIKGKVHAVIKEMDKENVDKLVCNMHQHVEMETPPISQEDEDCEKTLVESQQNVEENMKFEYHELRCADYEEMMHKTQEPDQNKQHANSQQEHLEKRAENTKEEPEYTPRNICDVEVERFEDAIEGVENENQPRNRGSEGDGKEKKGIHMAEDVESDRGHMTIDEKRSTLHDGEESGENFRRSELKESENYVRSYGDEKPENIEKESVEIQVLPQAHYRRNMSRESGPWSSDASENNADSQGACRPDMINDNYSKTNQQVDDKSRSIDKATTDFYDFKVREAEEAKIACTEFSETASLVHGAAEGRNNMKTVFEVLPSENSIPMFGLTKTDLENTEAEKRERDFGPNINSDNGAQILVNRSLGKGYIFEENETYCDEEAEKNTHEIANGEGQHVVIMKNFGIYSGPSVSSKIEKVVEVDKEIRARQNTQINEENSCNTTAEEDKEMKKMNTENDIDGKEGHPKEIFAKKETETKEAESKGAVENEYLRKNYEENKRERQREKDRIAVERAIQEARDRAFAEARERAAMDRAAAEVRQRVMVETRGKLEKSTTTSKSSVDRASIEAKIRSERAAVERATAEARERALEKALSQNTASRAHADKSATGNVSDSFRDAATKISDGTTTESAQRSKARSERQERIMERAAKALAEKNMRDLLVQKEEAEKNRLAESLDTEIKRWSSGKEGNLRALLSTLHYILGPGSGWQPISLTDIITTNAVKKAYRKATLYVHPDKLQQRGASIREKYICEKVFDLLKVAWNRFNSEER